MKKYLILAVMVLSFNVSATDIEDMTKEEVKVIHIELYEALIANTTEDICKEFDEFRTKAYQLKKIQILDFEANTRTMDANAECNGIGYIF